MLSRTLIRAICTLLVSFALSCSIPACATSYYSIGVGYLDGACTDSSGTIVAFGSSETDAFNSFSQGGTLRGACTSASAPSPSGSFNMSSDPLYVLVVAGFDKTLPEDCLDEPANCVFFEAVFPKPQETSGYQLGVSIFDECKGVTCPAGQTCYVDTPCGIFDTSCAPQPWRCAAASVQCAVTADGVGTCSIVSP